MKHEHKRLGQWIPCSIVAYLQYGTVIIRYQIDGIPYQCRANIYSNVRGVPQ